MSKKIACLLLVLILVLSSTGMIAFARQPDRTFTYDETNAVPSTNIYQAKIIVDEAVMGTSRMTEPTDIFVDDSDRIFVLDGGNCRILILDQNYRCIKELSEFKLDGKTYKLKEGAQGLFFRESNKMLYICDTENDRILVSDLDGNLTKIYKKPVDDQINAETAYKPSKIVVDNMGIMYVLSNTINTGAVMLDANNTFLGFYGVNKMTLTAEMQLEYFWRDLLPDSMAGKSEASFQPVEYYNIFWSADRFVYAISPVSAQMKTVCVKLNALGNNVFPSAFDFVTMEKNAAVTAMQLMDLTVDKEGAITILDLTTCRLYQYDENCNLLAIFGGDGYQKGLFTRPVSIECDSSNNLLVLDAAKGNITVIEQTYYGQMIRSANVLYNEGRYQESIDPWMDVLRMNANYTQAYVGLGKAYIGMGDYEKAMEFFKVGKDQAGYAEAKAALRDETVREYFGLVAAVVIIGMVSILGYDQLKAIASKIYWKVRK